MSQKQQLVNHQRQGGVSTRKVNEPSYSYKQLYEVAQAVNSAGDPKAVLQSIVESVVESVGAKGCSIMLFTPNRRLLLHSAACGLSEQYIIKGPVSVDKSISETLEGKPVVVLDTAKDERIQYPDHAKKEGIASILSVPMRHNEDIIGVMRVYTSGPRHFTSDDIDFVTAASNLGAIALKNAKRYSRLREEYATFRGVAF